MGPDFLDSFLYQFVSQANRHNFWHDVWIDEAVDFEDKPYTGDFTLNGVRMGYDLPLPDHYIDAGLHMKDHLIVDRDEMLDMSVEDNKTLEDMPVYHNLQVTFDIEYNRYRWRTAKPVITTCEEVPDVKTTDLATL